MYSKPHFPDCALESFNLSTGTLCHVFFTNNLIVAGWLVRHVHVGASKPHLLIVCGAKCDSHHDSAYPDRHLRSAKAAVISDLSYHST